jgi:hypothetical protein
MKALLPRLLLLAPGLFLLLPRLLLWPGRALGGDQPIARVTLKALAEACTGVGRPLPLGVGALPPIIEGAVRNRTLPTITLAATKRVFALGLGETI